MLDEIQSYRRVDMKDLFHMVSDYHNFIDLLLKMLNYLPEKRITAREALSHPYFNSIK
jgi:serine/threonine protein kinase